MRRIKFPQNKYVGDTVTRVVHDLDREDCSDDGCRINEAIMQGSVVTFQPDRLTEAHWQDFISCPCCIGKSMSLESGL